MSDYNLTVPEAVYRSVEKIAQATGQRLDIVLLNHLQLLVDNVPMLSTDEEIELQALHYLSDDALWTIAREQMPLDVQKQMQVLMDKNSLGTITSDERKELTLLVERGQQLMLRKSEAAAVLTQRGYTIKPKDLKARE
jgi:hypothetical protein